MSKNKKQYNNENQLSGLTNFVPTKSQKQVNNLLIEFPLVFVQGSSGTGKTSGILYHYCNEYIADKSKKIIVIRTPVEAGPDKIGALPGDKSEKLEPHFSAPSGALRELLGNKFDADLNKRIFFTVPNYALGMTLDNALVLIDEAQQITPDIMKMLLERLGKNTICAVVGDPSQLYVEGRTKRNGLSHAIDKFFTKRELMNRVEYEPRSNLVASFTYDSSDNVRSDISAEVVRIYET